MDAARSAPHSCKGPAVDVLELRIPGLAYPLKVHSAQLSHAVEMEEEHPGGDETGSRWLWMGGRLLAAWLAHLPSEDADKLLRNRRLIELGCGYAALPARVASRFGTSLCAASDAASPTLRSLQSHLAAEGEVHNEPSVMHLEWDNPGSAGVWDVVLFADAVYSEEGSASLASCCGRLLAGDDIDKDIGNTPCVLGMLSGLRPDAGAALLKAMREQGLVATEVAIPQSVRETAESLGTSSSQGDSAEHQLLQAGGSATGYRLIRWNWAGKEDPDAEGLRLERMFRDELAQRAPVLCPMKPAHLR